MMKQISFALLFLALSICVPIFYRELLFQTVSTLGFSWLLTNILLRLLTIIFFALFLHAVFKLFWAQRKIKFLYTFIIAIVPGFGVSFISPIYNVDYGMLSDDMQLTNQETLDTYLTVDNSTHSGKSLYVFFTSTCPHCMEASERLGANLDAGQKIPVYAFLPSTPEDAEEFLGKHNGKKFNVGLIHNDSFFLSVSGGVFPSVFLVDDTGKTTHHWTGDELNYTALDYLKSLEQ